MLKRLNLRAAATIFFAGLLLTLALLGGSWKTSTAESIPTIPLAEAISPFRVKAGSPELLVTISGSNFIPYSTYHDIYTVVRWTTPPGTIPSATHTLSPVPETLTAGSLQVWVPQSFLAYPGIAKLKVVNHPGMNEVEVSGELSFTVFTQIYLPLVRR